VYVSASSTMTTAWGDTIATFNQQYIEPFKTAMVNSSGYISKPNQVSNVYANTTTSTRRRLLSTIDIDVSFTITIDLTDLGLTAADASDAIETFTDQLITTMNATGSASFASKFATAVSDSGLTAVTFTPDVSATAAALNTMTFDVITQSPTSQPTPLPTASTGTSPTSSPTKRPTMRPTIAPTLDNIQTAGSTGLIPSYLVALLCVCLSGWQLWK